MVCDQWPKYRCSPRALARSLMSGSNRLFCKTTLSCLLVFLISTLLRVADAQAYGYARGNESGSCKGDGGESGTCTFSLFCLLSGGQSHGSCGNSLLYTCCAPRVITIRQSPPQAPARRQPAAISPPVSYPSSYANYYQQSNPSRYQYPQSNSVSGANYGSAPSYAVGNSRSTNSNSYNSFRQRIGYIVESCGKPIPKPQSRIVGGQDAMYGEFPWQAHIKISRQQCGGALVSAYFVLTAAHCVYKARLDDITIILGAYDIQDQRHQLYPAYYLRPVEKIIHPYFRFSPSHPDRYDVALLRLEKAVQFQDHVLPICLPPPNKEFQGWRALVTGWGKTDPALSGNRYGTRLLQKVDVPIIANEECERWHRTRGINLKIYPEMMCAGYEVGLKDACVGDSGGPLITYVDGRWTLVGVTSAGFGCAQSRQPGIYHRVPTTVDWIYTNIY